MIAITSCWHIRGDRLKEQTHWIREALRSMKQQGVRAILHCGDLFHRPAIGSKDAAAPTVIGELREALHGFGIPLFLAEGNHDQLEGKYSAIRALDGLQHLVYMGEIPTGFNMNNVEAPGFEDVQFLAVDWTPQMDNEIWKERLVERITSALRWSKENNKHHRGRVVVYGHVDVSQVPRMDECSWPNMTSESVSEAVRNIPGLTHCSFFFGHNHSGFGQSCCHRRPVVGVCAMMRHTWGEAGNIDGWYLLDSETLTAKHMPLNGPVWVDYTEKADIIRIPELPAYSRVRLRKNQVAGRLDTESKLSVELMPELATERQRTQRETNIRPGMGMLEAFQMYCELPIGTEPWEFWSESAVKEASKILTEILQESDRPNKRPAVRKIESVEFGDHVGVRSEWGVSDGRSWKFEDGWNLIIGPTGAGKSSILEAAYGALTGSWASPCRKGPTAFWMAFGQRGRLAATVRLNDGRSLSVNRYQSGGHKLTASLDEQPITAFNQPTKVQPAIDRLTGDLDLWLRSSFLTQDRAQDLVESAPESRLQALNDLLGITEISLIREAVAKRLKALEGKREAFERVLSQIAELERQEIIAEEPLELALAKAEVERTEAQQRYTELLDLRTRLNAQEEMKELLERQRGSVPDSEAIENASDQVEIWKNKLEDAQTVERTVRMLQIKVDQKQRAEEKLCSIGCASNPLPCPLIDRAGEEVTEGIRAEQELLNYPPLELAQRTAATAKETLSQHSRRLYELEQARDLARQTEARLEVLRRKVTDAPVGTYSETMFREAEECLKTATDVQDRVHQQLGYARGSNTYRERQLERCNFARIQLEAELVEYGPLKLLSQAFGRDGIQRLILEQSLVGIQEEIDNLLNSACLASTYQIQLDYPKANDTKGVPSVLASIRGGPWVDARLLSGGQRQIVRLLVRLACCSWLSYTNPGGVLLLDEPTQGVSEEFVEQLISVLKTLVGTGKPFRQAIVATHDEYLTNALGGWLFRL